MESPPPSRTSEPSATSAPSKRRLILDAARVVLSTNGFDAARMDEVARIARVSKGTLYNHFASKEALLVETVQDAIRETVGLMTERLRDRAAEGGDALEALLAVLFLDLFPIVAEQRRALSFQVWGVIARDPKTRDELFATYRNLHAERDAWLHRELRLGMSERRLRGDLDPESVAMLIFAAFDGLVYRAIFDGESVDPQRVYRSVSSLLALGLRNPAAPSLRSVQPKSDTSQRSAGRGE